ncbi:MAG: hypothetical protein H6510_04770 [Acidobacteria bacterium]|nr:hypothetical protein [Acidobacteriota bacterium]MCB9397109.1 hypothetical protein [Acidobacteriota bacterium]
MRILSGLDSYRQNLPVETPRPEKNSFALANPQPIDVTDSYEPFDLEAAYQASKTFQFNRYPAERVAPSQIVQRYQNAVASPRFGDLVDVVA